MDEERKNPPQTSSNEAKTPPEEVNSRPDEQVVSVDSETDATTAPCAKSRCRRPWRVFALSVLCLLTVIITALSIYLHSNSYKQYLRRTVIEKLETATGGRVELQSIHLKVWQRELLISGLTIHGLEAPTDVPYVHADAITLHIKLRTFFQHGLQLRDITLERPIYHLIYHGDGTSNIPKPKIPSPGREDVFTPLIDLAANHIEIHNGWFIWNQTDWPLELNAQDIKVSLAYKPKDRDYQGHLQVKGIHLQIMHLLPMPVSVDANFALLPDHLDIQQARVATGDTVIDTHGVVKDFTNTRLELAYRATTELAWVHRIGDVPGINKGHAVLTGSGFLQDGNYLTTGNLVVTGGGYQDNSLRLENVTAAAKYSMNSDGVRLDHFTAQTLGGTATGSLSAPWDAALTPQPGDIQVQLHVIPLANALSALSTTSLPLDKFKGSGELNGSLHTHWRHAMHAAVTEFLLHTTAPAVVAPGTVPYSGEIECSYNNPTSDWTFKRFAFASPTSSIDASGSLSDHGGSLRLRASTTHYAEWAPFIDALNTKPLPISLRGGSFEGTVQGRLSAAAISGHFHLNDFATQLPEQTPASGTTIQLTNAKASNSKPSNAQSPAPRWLHFDEFSGTLDYSPHLLRLSSATLRHGAATVEIDLDLPLVGGSPQTNSPLNAHLRLRQVDMAELLRLEKREEPISGTLAANLTISGTYGSPSGSGAISLRNASLYQIPVKQVGGELRFDGSQVAVNNIEASGAFGKVHGSASVVLASEAFRFTLEGSALDLGELAAPHISRVKLDGRLGVKISGSGTPQAPQFQASGSIEHFTLNRAPLGRCSFTLYTGGEYLHASLQSTGARNILKLDGTVHLRDQWQSHWQASLVASDLTPQLATLLPVHLASPTTLTASASADGPLFRPSEITAALTVDNFSTTIEKIQLRNLGTVRLSLARQVVTVEQLRLSGEQNHFFELNGTAELSGANKLWMRASGDMDLQLLQTLQPGLTSSGAANFDVRIAGTLDKPRLDGHLQINNGALNTESLPNSLSEINGNLVFSQDRLQIEKLTAHTGGGEVDFSGFMTYDHGLDLMLTANAKDVRVRYPVGISSAGNAKLTLSGTPHDLSLAGTITITRFGVNEQFDVAELLAHSKEPIASAPTTGATSNMRLDVHLLTVPELQVQTGQLRVAGNADLRLRGTVAHPSLLGRINMSEGTLDFNGARYRLDRGDIAFNNPVKIEPMLNMQLSATVRDYDITLGLNGTLDKLRPTYHSDPPLPESDIVALLAFGRTSQSSTKYSGIAGSQQQTMTLTDSASSQFLGQALNSTLSSRAQKLFGVSRINIDPQVGGTTTTTNARVTIEQQISNKVKLTYISNVAQASQQVIQFEYNINRNVSILAVRDENGIIGVEVRVRQRKR